MTDDEQMTYLREAMRDGLQDMLDAWLGKARPLLETLTRAACEPITQCKLYKSQVDALDNATLKDLCALMGGQLADEQGVSLTDKLNGKVPPSLLSKILRGQTHYKAAYTQCRLTIPGKVDISDSGKIGSRAGLPSLPDGQVWLCAGGGLTRRNGRTVTQVTYIGGEWDQEIYK